MSRKVSGSRSMYRVRIGEPSSWLASWRSKNWEKYEGALEFSVFRLEEGGSGLTIRGNGCATGIVSTKGAGRTEGRRTSSGRAYCQSGWKTPLDQKVSVG